MILRLFDFFAKHKRICWSLCVLLFILLIGLASQISFQEDIAGFMPQNKQTQKINYITSNVATVNTITVRFSIADKVVEQDSLEILMTAVDQFVTHLDTTKNSSIIKSVTSHIDPTVMSDVVMFLTENIPYFLTEWDYLRIDSILQTNFDPILENDKELLLSHKGIAISEQLLSDPLHLSTPILERLKSFQIGDKFSMIDGYICSSDRKSIFVFIEPVNAISETKNNEVLSDLIDSAVDRVNQEVEVNYFGGSLVAVANARQIKEDTLFTLSIAIVLILLILLSYFRRFTTLIWLIVPVLFGGLFALAIFFLLKGSVSAIAIGAGSIIFGIAINYAIHFLIHSQEQQDSRKALKDIVKPMLIGNLTTVGAFLSLIFISAESMRDFGLFAAFSLVGTIVFVLIFMPHLVHPSSGQSVNYFAPIVNFELKRPKLLKYLLLLITAVTFYYCSDVAFDANMHNINFMTEQQRQDYQQLSQVTTLGSSNIYLAAEGNNINEALKIYEQQQNRIAELKKEGVISSVHSIDIFLPSDSVQQIKIEQWNSFWKNRREAVINKLQISASNAQFTSDAFHSFHRILERSYTIQPAEYFHCLQSGLLDNYIIKGDSVNPTMILSLLYADSDAKTVSPHFETIDKTTLFDTAGITETMIHLLSADFNMVLFFCAILVFFFLYIAFGRIELAILAFLPMIISWIWILGVMGLCGISFNIINIILATFIFGMGDDYVIFITDGLIGEYRNGQKLLASYKTSIFLSAITMFVGIGILVLAKHPAMQSLGAVTIIGMLAVIIAAYTIPPTIFRYLTTTKGKPRPKPITWKTTLNDCLSFVGFICGSLFLTIYGFIFLTLLKSTERRKLAFHTTLSKMLSLTAKWMPNVTYQVKGDTSTFLQPSIIIANHQSHLDLMYLLMLSPKIVVLTNKWAWNFPIYGTIIRYADFYPVVDNIEHSVDHLRALVQQGYSIAIFPEGTRSQDLEIHRFHRGAFYLAKEFNLDIQPILFHGTGHVLPKVDFTLQKGSVTVDILPRIQSLSDRFGTTAAEQAKQIRQYMREHYQDLVIEQEQCHYFINLLQLNYIYKGQDVEKETKQFLKNIDKWQQLINTLPEEGKVLFTNCGIGQLPLLTALVKKKLTIVAIDKSQDNISIAQHCYSKPERLCYQCQTIDKITINSFDKIIDMTNEKQL